MTHKLLVVDDEPDLRTLYELTLLRDGYDVQAAGSVEDALLCLGEHTYSGVITDMRLPDGSGLDVLRWLMQADRPEKTIVITAYGSAEGAVEALRAGAYDYLTKPVDLRQFRAVVAAALGLAPKPATVIARPAPAANARSVASPAQPAAPINTASASPSTSFTSVNPMATPAKPTAESTTPRPATSAALQRMVGVSAAMDHVRTLVEKVARSMAPVLVSGESGTGKELVARAIHQVSARHAQPFIAVNCGAIPEHLLEAEFFGYRKGAFTGAADDRDGFFVAAHGGTLFLDEIGELPITMQSKLLRAVQERAVRPVGAVAEQIVNVRLLSATHKDLGVEVRAGAFRQDLYYRLNVIQIRVPPLRERASDLPLIAAHLLARIARDAGVTPAPTLTAGALEHLARHAFPGNVRELENLLHRAVALSEGDAVDVADLALPPEVFAEQDPVDAAATTALRPSAVMADAPVAPTEPPLPPDLETYLDDIERDVLVRALARHRYNRTAAGARLGLSLRQMRYRMARLRIQVGTGPDEPDE